MKLALLLVLCLLAGAFNAARAQPPPEDGQVDDGASYEDGGEPDDIQGEGSFEGDGPEDGYEGDDGAPEYDDEEVAPEEGAPEEGAPEETAPGEENPQPAEAKEGTAAAHGGGYHHHRRHHHHRHHGGHRFGRRWGGWGGWGGFGYRRRHHFRGHGAEIDRNTCSVQASYFLSFNGQRRYCRHATDDHDDCQACCEAATRRETRGASKDDVIGFITRDARGDGYRGKREAGLAYGSDKEHNRDYRARQKWECVCCIPKSGHH